MISLGVALLLSPSQPTKDVIIRDARAMAKEASRFAEKNEGLKQMFMQDAENTDKWTRMENEESHLDKDGMWQAGDVAFTWLKSGSWVALCSVSSGSPSGDWGAQTEYTFRPDGSLAIISSRYAGFSPVEGAVIRERIFDANGKLVHEGAKCQDLSGRKLITGDEAKEMRQYAPKVPNYLRSRDLPFYSQLKFQARR